MCGFLLSSNVETNLNNFNLSLKEINHRGPDSNDVYKSINSNLYLGHNRLSIIDVELGNQPYWSDDKQQVILYNGEIYNFKEIKSQLLKNGLNFNSNSDTEVILKLYQSAGYESFNILRGMFSFFIIDFKNNIIISSRDYYGKKPLYFYTENNSLIISSELTPIVKLLKNNLKISQSNFEFFICNGYYNNEKTIYENIYKQESNSTFIFDLKNSEIIKKIKIFDKKKLLNEQNLSLYENVYNSISKRLVADKEIGCFLSGGVDSSLISIISNNIQPGISTFSAFFENKEYDESQSVKDFCKSYGINNKNITITKSIVNSSFEEIFKTSEPICDSSIIPTFILSKYAKNYVDVCLTGDGADELFYGYNVFNALYASYFFDRLKFSKICNLFAKYSKFNEYNGYFNPLFILKKFINGFGVNQDQRLNNFLQPVYDDQLLSLFGSNFSQNKKTTTKNFNSANEFMKYNRDLIMKNYLTSNILVKADMASMRASLELRSPFLDPSVLEYSQNNQDYKLNNKSKIFKKEFNSVLSKKYIVKKKHGFAMPNNLIFNKENIDYFYSIKDLFGLNTDMLNNYFDMNMKNKINLKNFFWGYIHLNKIIDNHKSIT